MIPNLFTKANIPNSIPKEMQIIIDKLKKSKNKEDCLKKAFDTLTKKYRGCRFYTYTKFFNLFIINLDELWKKRGCLHCTTLNYLLRVLLVKSRLFIDNDIKLKLTLVYYISIHQYLKVKINKNKSINVDLWGQAYGTKLGDYAHGFH